MNEHTATATVNQPESRFGLQLPAQVWTAARHATILKNYRLGH